MREVHARERHIPVLVTVLGSDRIVHRGLRRERQHGDAVVTQLLPVTGQQRDIGGEDLVEQFRSVEEVLEVRGILLVPEHRGDTVLPAVRDEVPQRPARRLGPGQLVLPGILVPVPGGLHQQQIHRRLRELFAPGPRGDGHRLELVGPGQHREVIEDHRDPQSGQVGPAIGLLRTGEGQLPLTVEGAEAVPHAEVRGAPPSLPGAQLRDATACADATDLCAGSGAGTSRTARASAPPGAGQDPAIL